MRRTSSLGRRSSTQPQHLRHTLGISDSANREQTGKKKSFLLKPGFSQGKCAERLSSSATKEPGMLKRASSQNNLNGSCKKMQVPNSMRKSTSQNNIHGLMTPVNPGYTLHENLPTGTSRPDRSQLHSTDSARMSSIGGTKILRKDTRPLTDKAYMNAAIAKIQNFFQMEPEPHMFGEKINFSRMTTNLFVDLVAYLLNLLGTRVLITRSNYLEELPNLLKSMKYRGKVDRSWLITVNAPHTLHNVIGLLEWLVNVVQCMSVNIENMMYPDDINESNNFEEDESPNFKILNPHLKWYYEHHCQRGYDEEAFSKRDELVLNELLEKADINNLEELEREYAELENEVNNPTQLEEEEIQKNQELKEAISMLRKDKESNNDFIQKSKIYLENVNQQIAMKEDDKEMLLKTLERKKSELQKLHSQVESQEIQLIDKEQLDGERLLIQRNIQQSQESYKGFENSVFKEDLLLVAVRKKVDNAIREYNKVITENRVYEPKLKNAELSGNILSKDVGEMRENIDRFLKDFKSEYKAEFENIETQEEEIAKQLNQVNEELSQILEDKERILSEKKSLEENLKVLKQNMRLKKKELKDECSKLELEKKGFSNRVPNIGMEELEKEKLKLKESEDNLVMAKEIGDKFLRTCRQIAEEKRAVLLKEQEILLEKLRSLNK